MVEVKLKQIEVMLRDISTPRFIIHQYMLTIWPDGKPTGIQHINTDCAWKLEFIVQNLLKNKLKPQ